MNHPIPRRVRLLVVHGLAGVLSVACGDPAPPTAPTTTPPTTPALVPAPTVTVTITGTITDTVTGQSIGSFTHTATNLPARVTLSAPGHVTRETWVHSPNPRVDLFPEPGFDLRLYRQLTRDDLAGGSLQPLWVLTQAPAFYVETEGAKGLSAQTVATMERIARAIVPTLTGGRFQVTRWETGPTPRSPQVGWIMVERRDEEAPICGRALIGASAGQIWLDANRRCSIQTVFAHELGHAFGFFHVDKPGSLMLPLLYNNDAPTDLERHHMTLSYSRPRGNTDIDVDPQTPTMFGGLRMVVD